LRKVANGQTDKNNGNIGGGNKSL